MVKDYLSRFSYRFWQSHQVYFVKLLLLLFLLRFFSMFLPFISLTMLGACSSTFLFWTNLPIFCHLDLYRSLFHAFDCFKIHLRRSCHWEIHITHAHWIRWLSSFLYRLLRQGNNKYQIHAFYLQTITLHRVIFLLGSEMNFVQLLKYLFHV